MEVKEGSIINKLILVGNGFDLALGLKTSYEHFLLWLIKKYFLLAYESGIEHAPFEKYKGKYDSFQKAYYKREVCGFSSNSLFDILINYNYSISREVIVDCDNFESLLEIFNSKKIEIIANEHSILFTEILNQSKFGWVDIEGTYFDLIKDILNNDKGLNNNDVEIINSELNTLVLELNCYLKTIDTSISFIDAQRYKNQFNECIYSIDILEGKNDSISSELTYFLNFNYTNSLEKVLNYFPKDKFEINHIHGSLDIDDSDIIFGFGDEMDEVYKKIENLNDNRFFEHIKSFKYFKSRDYRDLMRFLDSGLYQVCIYGHSCGLSDRIMLNEIFEHNNCKSIKIYFYEDDNGKNDFVNKTMEISRHFNSNKLMRKRIVDFNIKNKIPQLKR